MVPVLLEHIVDGGGEELEHDTEVLAEHEEVKHPHQRVVAARVIHAVDLHGLGGLRAYDIKDFDLYNPLVLEGLLVFDDLNGHRLLGLSALAFHYLPEGAFAEHVEDLISTSISEG